MDSISSSISDREGQYVSWNRDDRMVVPVFSSGHAAARCVQKLAEESGEVVSLGVIEVTPEALPAFAKPGIMMLMNPGLETQTEITAEELNHLRASLGL
jgi:hypothetical protein